MEEDKSVILVKTKMCTGCLLWLPLSSFFTNRRMKRTGKNPRCRQCVSKYYKKYYPTNKEAWKKEYVRKTIPISMLPPEFKPENIINKPIETTKEEIK